MSVIATRYINKARNDLMQAASKAFGVSVKVITVRITSWADGDWRVSVWHKTPAGEIQEVAVQATSLIDALTKARDRALRRAKR
tara:strand:- start:3453 stop:3704 length:252 start_codon:yes stop_codon:yes gene_type:complete